MSLKFYNPKIELLKGFTGIFKINNCRYCRMYERFIERIIANFPPEINFQIIDCTLYHDYGIVTDNRIPLFIKHYEGSYPSMFIKGLLVPGANSAEELMAFVKSYFKDDFIADETLHDEVNGIYYDYTFNKNCKFVKKGWFKKELKCYG